jgi:hypothetical protein
LRPLTEKFTYVMLKQPLFANIYGLIYFTHVMLKQPLFANIYGLNYNERNREVCRMKSTAA